MWELGQDVFEVFLESLVLLLLNESPDSRVEAIVLKDHVHELGGDHERQDAEVVDKLVLDFLVSDINTVEHVSLVYKTDYKRVPGGHTHHDTEVQECVQNNNVHKE